MIIPPATGLSGSLLLPGDKSISHRYAMLASISEGASVIRNFSTGADCHSTLGAMRELGVKIAEDGTEVSIEGRGLHGLKPSARELDAGNSGSTIRMLSGILAAQPFTTRMGGDPSLSRRPMGRIIAPLEMMGARVEAREGKYPPLVVHGGPLLPVDYTPPVPSAQVKTCVLFAGLFASGRTTVREAVRSRDHTEIALREFGAAVATERGAVHVDGGNALRGGEFYVPSDLSSAAFFLVAALLLPGSDVVIRGVGLNPTRSALLDLLLEWGAPLQVVNLEQVNGEMIGDIQVRSAPVRGGTIEGATTAALIDEIPVLAVLGAASEEGLTVRNAQELRVKETDRIATVVENLRRMGIAAEAAEDGMRVPGKQSFRAATFDSFGDHRIAMAFSVAALRADGPCTIEGAEAASVSFPNFYELLESVRVS